MLGRSIHRVTALSWLEFQTELSVPDWTGIEGAFEDEKEEEEAFLSSCDLFKTFPMISSMIDSV